MGKQLMWQMALGFILYPKYVYHQLKHRKRKAGINKFCCLRDRNNTTFRYFSLFWAGINKMFGSGHLTPIKEGRAGGKFFLGIFINYAYDI